MFTTIKSPVSHVRPPRNLTENSPDLAFLDVSASNANRTGGELSRNMQKLGPYYAKHAFGCI